MEPRGAAVRLTWRSVDDSLPNLPIVLATSLCHTIHALSFKMFHSKSRDYTRINPLLFRNDDFTEWRDASGDTWTTRGARVENTELCAAINVTLSVTEMLIFAVVFIVYIFYSICSRKWVLM